MKRIFFFIFFAMICASGFAQTNADSLLCRTWKNDFQQTYNLMSVASKQSYDNLPEIQKQQIQQNLSLQRFNFQPTGGFVLQYAVNGITETATGTWQWLQNNTKVMVQVEGETSTYALISLNMQSLILDTENTQTGLFDKLSFIPTL
jgi:hypothetical protein